MSGVFNVQDGVELIGQLSMRGSTNGYLLGKVSAGAESEPEA
jgi:hypothetical protein